VSTSGLELATDFTGLERRSTLGHASMTPAYSTMSARCFLISGVSIVGKVGHMLFFCTGAGTHNFQIASKGVQYRVKWRVLDHIRPPFTLQNFQCSIETIFAF